MRHVIKAEKTEGALPDERRRREVRKAVFEEIERMPEIRLYFDLPEEKPACVRPYFSASDRC
jgi:hypothetical protein